MEPRVIYLRAWNLLNYLKCSILHNEVKCSCHEQRWRGFKKGIANPKKETTRPEGNLDGLTPRESEILKLVAKGDTNKEIAATLSITESTVKLHLHNILGKTQLHNRIQLAIYAVRQGLGSDTSNPT